ncbi:MAG: hypothetical protein ACE5EX_07290, partial [Phycisphaerae bacterium]
WLIAWEGPSEERMWLSRIYLGYRATPLGSLIGLAWALPDGAVAGVLFAWLYNRFAREKAAGPSV